MSKFISKSKFWFALFSIFFIYINIINGLDEVSEQENQYPGAPGVNPQKGFMVHIVCHSHDDSGWLDTIDGYYNTRVDNIISTVTEAMIANPNRKFVWSEIGFLTKWWARNPAFRDKFQKLVNESQMEFVNGGWVMSDEACTSAEAFIDNLEEGNRFIKEQFGERFLPMSGWQIDPFGHASKTAALEAMDNYKNIILHRITTDLRDELGRKKDLEFIWRGSHGNNSEIFTHVLDDPYWFPDFNLDEPMGTVDDNVQRLVFDLKHTIIRRRDHYKSPHILVLIGGDFKYNNAQTAFEIIDKTIDNLNLNTVEFNVKYSTMGNYFSDVRKWFRQTGTPIKHQYSNTDFMPYIENNIGDNWVGYYTTNPIFKRESRRLTSLQRLGELINTQTGANIESQLRDTMRNSSFIQHHDAITGTHLVHVGVDYMNRMQYAIAKLGESIATSTNLLAMKSNKMNSITHSDTDSLPLVFFNPLGWNRKEVKMISMFTTYNPGYCPFAVFEEDSQIPIECTISSIGVENFNWTIAFVIDIQALSYKVFKIQTIGNESPFSKLLTEQKIPGLKILENNYIKVELTDKGFINSISEKNGVSHNILQKIMRYRTSYRNGAYIFRANGPAVEENLNFSLTTFILGNIYSQVRIKFNQDEVVIRLYNTGSKIYDENVDISYTLPDCDNTDRIVRFQTDINGSFYSDDGFELRERAVYNTTGPIDRAYVPSVTTALLMDPNSGVGFVCNSDRSKGAAAIYEGNIEFGITRSSYYDDSKGLSYPSMPKKTTTVNHRCRLDRDPLNYKGQNYRFNEPIYQVQQNMVPNSKAYSKIENQLPENIHVLNFKRFNGEFLIRLINIYPAETRIATSVNLPTIFRSLEPDNCREMYIGGSSEMNYSDMNLCKTTFNCTYEPIVTYIIGGIRTARDPPGGSDLLPLPINECFIRIQPGEIKTIRFSAS
ncbi:hypothetical protein PPL_07851 [Heterostelium album PN500]|uniref:alpha-mannosidase n=1 Tax=Heterostelium pallidum (strain ATCC 26659 / Pp 5 / PN500) TaxID=670386 RepID=D3BH49_HETP5|nr:hypothetical protein PPL_07851 [Heterostelium album PN500]EFA79433.1 hypothetical protein PPL_07851 [Heterostelium album PN500]|eukprot:XP_020431554.1 hypothetical protein PPL_07851 [Heterostelium album PN500]